MPLGFGNKSYGEPWQYKVPPELLAKASKPESLNFIDAMTNAIDMYKKKRMEGTQDVPMLSENRVTGGLEQVGGYTGKVGDAPMMLPYGSASKQAGAAKDTAAKNAGIKAQFLKTLFASAGTQVASRYNGSWDPLAGEFLNMSKLPKGVDPHKEQLDETIKAWKALEPLLGLNANESGEYSGFMPSVPPIKQ